MASKPSRPPRMLERGILCVIIGIAVLLGPRFLQSPTWRDMVGGAYLVGWFALVLGLALVAGELLQRLKKRQR
ncbi:hypothetical protein [Variovorax sp. PvP013]|uniref:hypothetical protein n=1 Tax=Variovorax sp. PvP013 TaxID=3156435 RepID=UPI002BEC3066|nr:hypothetical protein [Variovorax sp.]